MVHFTIRTLTGKRIDFDFDLNSSLKEFREQIDLENYTLIESNKHRIYANDNEKLTLRALFEAYNPDLLNKEEITFYLLLNLGLPKQREGVKLIPNKKRQKFEDNDGISTLICPITQELICDAVKINDRFYDLFAMAEYLNNEYEKYCHEHQFVDGRAFRMVCPLRMNIPQEMANGIIRHHQTPYLFPATKNSMVAFLLGRDQYASDQTEYNKLIEEHQPAMLEDKHQAVLFELENQYEEPEVEPGKSMLGKRKRR